MPDLDAPETSIAKHIMDLSREAIPDFILQQTADRTLSAAVSELNKQVLFGGRTEKETALEALTRLGFVHPTTNG